VAHLVSDGEGGSEADVLVDATTAVRLTHAGDRGKTWRHQPEMAVEVQQHYMLFNAPYEYSLYVGRRFDIVVCLMLVVNWDTSKYAHLVK